MPSEEGIGTRKVSGLALSILHTFKVLGAKVLCIPTFRQVAIQDPEGQIALDLLLEDSSPVARRFFNALAEEPETVAAALIPQIQAIQVLIVFFHRACPRRLLRYACRVTSGWAHCASHRRSVVLLHRMILMLHAAITITRLATRSLGP